MLQNFNLKLILTILLFTSILGADPLELTFEEAKNLIFKSDSRWEFTIKYSTDSPLINETIHYTSILFNESQKIAPCEVAGNILNCHLNEGKQTIYDLIQLNNEVTTGATIHWTNLNEVKDIAINATLMYEDSYSLTYYSSGQYWTFRVKLEQKVLPENGFLILDLFFYITEKITASCKHRDYYLYCEFKRYKPTTYLVLISPTTLYGSVQWGNLENNVTIPLSYTARSFNQPRFLKLVNNQWTYNIYSSGTDLAGIPLQSLITMNTKIISKTGETYIYLTRCYVTNASSNTRVFGCTVFGEHQEITDVVYATNSNINDISVDWNGILTSDYLIIRTAELSFVKIYDHYYANSYWHFKILVEDDEYLPENSLVDIDIFNPVAGYPYTTCSFQNHIIICDKIASLGSTYLIIFESEKDRGSVTWKNLQLKYIKIPLNYQLTFTKANISFFTDKWNFIITARHIGYAPRNSKIVIDIIQNSKETTATCEILKTINGNENFYTLCTSDLEQQSINDVIRINPTKKVGTVTWNTGLTESNNLVEKISLVDNILSMESAFYDAYDLYYSNNKWFFTISCRPGISGNNYKNILGLYKVDITVIKTSGQLNAIANCLIYEGITRDARLLCSCEYDNQSKDDLIKVSYTKTASSTVTWTQGIKKDFTMTLKTVLAIEKAYNLTVNTYWCFNIDIVNDVNSILPLNSKVIVDIYGNGVNDETTANCTTFDYYKLYCRANSGTTGEPKLVYTKSDKSSVTWTNEDEEVYYMLRTAKVFFRSVQYLYFQNNKWHFNMSVSDLYNAIVIVDILYNDEPSTATCYGGRNGLICTVDKETQSKTDYIKLSKTKTDASTITWNNVNQDKDISLLRELTFDKVNNLHREDDDLFFDIYIQDEDVPENGYVVVDIKLYQVSYKRLYAIANCIHNSKKLTCKVVTEYSDKFLYSSYLVGKKIAGTESSVIQWKEIPNDPMPITLTADLKYFYAHKIFEENGKNFFYIELDSTTKVPNEAICIIDIIIDNSNQLSNCFGINQTTLKCEIDTNENLKKKKVYIAKDKTSESTITWTNLKGNQILFPIELTYIHAFGLYVLGGTSIKILASGKELKNGYILPVKVKIAKKGNVENINIAEIPCECEYNVLICSTSKSGFRADRDIIYLELEEKGNPIEWTNPGDISLYSPGLVHFIGFPSSSSSK